MYMEVKNGVNASGDKLYFVAGEVAAQLCQKFPEFGDIVLGYITKVRRTERRERPTLYKLVPMDLTVYSCKCTSSTNLSSSVVGLTFRSHSHSRSHPTPTPTPSTVPSPRASLTQARYRGRRTARPSISRHSKQCAGTTYPSSKGKSRARPTMTRTRRKWSSSLATTLRFSRRSAGVRWGVSTRPGRGLRAH